MGGGYPTPTNGEAGALVQEVRQTRRALRDGARPGGTRIGQLYDQVQQTLANIVSQVNSIATAWMAANAYTKAQVDSKVASPGAISPTTVTASGAVSGTTGRFDSGLYSTDAYSFNMTGTRVTGWHQIDGHIGTASSSERFKTNIVDAQLIDKAEAILAIEIDYYNYRAEIAKRDDPSSANYVGPEYQVHQELGAIAERLHEAGLWEFVVYERDTITETRYRDAEKVVVDEDGEEHTEVVQEPYTVYLGDTLRLGDDGEPIPFGIHYDLLGIAAIAAAQYLHRLYKAQQEQIDANTTAIAALRAHVGLTD
jgi:hypothetical protein